MVCEALEFPREDRLLSVLDPEVRVAPNKSRVGHSVLAVVHVATERDSVVEGQAHLWHGVSHCHTADVHVRVVVPRSQVGFRHRSQETGWNYMYMRK